MPLHTKKRSEADVRSLPDDLSSNEEVFVVRFTGEVFRDYEEYLRAISQYRQRVWTCRLTGKDNLSFEEALASEQGGKDFSGKFPKVCEEAASHLVHWALARMDELLTRVTNFFRDYFVAGEEVLGRSGDAFAMCRIMSRAQIQASPDNTYYEVAWLDGPQKGGFATLPRNFLARRKPPFSRGTLKAWLMENASSREVGRPGGAKGPLSLWQVRQNMAQRFQLPSDPPPHVVQQVRRIESNSAEGGLSASSTSAGSPVRAEGSRIAIRPAQVQRQRPDRSEQLLDDEGITGDDDDDEREQRPAIFDVEAFLGVRLRDPTTISYEQLDAELHEKFERMLPAYENGDNPVAQAVEPLHQTQARLQPGSVKDAIFRILRESGVQGLTISEIAEAMHGFGLKDWGDIKTAKNSIASTCLHDAAFARVAKGRFALRALPGVLEAEASVKGNDAVIATAAKAVAQIEVQAMKFIGGMIDKLREEATNPRENRIKCTSCGLTYPLPNSPLLLCDICQGCQHLSCLSKGGASLGDLPNGEWYCDKCMERRDVVLQRLQDMEAKKLEALEKVAAAEQERVERVQRAQRERLEKERIRQEKEQRKIEEKVEREKRKAEDKKRALLESKRPRYPKDDEKVLAEEIAVLEHLQKLSQLSEEELSEKKPPQLDLDDEDGLSLAVLDADRQWRQLSPRDREKLIERTHQLIRGPEPGHRLGGDLPVTFCDSAAVTEFIGRFADFLEVVPRSVSSLRQAARWPLESRVLVDTYCGIMRVMLLDFLKPDHYLKSRARRWARLFDESCWPEVLRRYLLFTRMHISPKTDPDTICPEEIPLLDNNQVALLAGVMLGRRHFHELPAELHLRLLRVLVDDLVSTSTMRTEIERRQETINSLNAEWAIAEMEDKRAIKAEEEARKEQLKARKEEEVARRKEDEEAEAAVMNAADCQEPSLELPPELQEYRGPPGSEQAYQRWQKKRAARLEQLEKRRQQWEEKRQRELEETREMLARRREQEAREAERQDAEAKVLADEARAARAADREAREAVYQENLRVHAVRVEPLGSDRHNRRYMWFENGEPHAVFVECDDGKELYCISRLREAEEIISTLNPKGVREERLLSNLKRVCGELTAKGVPLPLSDIPKPVTKPGRSNVSSGKNYIGASIVRAVLFKMEEFARELHSQTELEVLEERARDLKALQHNPGVQQAVEAILALERDMAAVGNGLPKSADDETIAPMLDGETIGPQFDIVVPDESTRKPRTEFEAETGPDEKPSDENDGGNGDEDGSKANEDQDTERAETEGDGNQDGDDDDDEEDEAGDEAGNYSYYGKESAKGFCFEAMEVPRKRKRGPGRPPKIPRLENLFPDGPHISLPDEMEFSDSDVLTSHVNHAHTVWRTARERIVWLRDMIRARKTENTAILAYAALGLADRAAPFLKKRKVGRRGATAFEEHNLRTWMREQANRPINEMDASISAQRIDKTTVRLRVAKSEQDAGATGSEPEAKEAAGIIKDGTVGEDGFMFTCIACGFGGDLLCCDGEGCSAVMHRQCAGLEEVPRDIWLCPDCATVVQVPKAPRSKIAKRARRESPTPAVTEESDAAQRAARGRRSQDASPFDASQASDEVPAAQAIPEERGSARGSSGDGRPPLSRQGKPARDDATPEEDSDDGPVRVPHVTKSGRMTVKLGAQGLARR
uniref:Bromodomain adjacent to zinc finger domain protein 1A n=1 Tax=Tetraselmis sp. GSL018 TaxID=582737 RepID=A0A061RK79_9CHLO|mmetsp:Transcript_2065/g.4882  ORF Transcript_2065/g.4882 Transcript_2065/m.4882 type:complete len:1677 (+) Transcript_2065:440-5470(+)|eukprot:CAMPEP_0177582990 /NCGR_PEP_ID=MMETSP0419_2-20121207/3065_1 /TAXON_ID=582737 /ORGANISM="Tetraselmis sp., Strain GSL018" /LENGTH=1676 /DNA_ID=CAMNT_0019072315 /DNA_START=400 /DNA_END=5430 /DNA_ORIENTATION=+